MSRLSRTALASAVALVLLSGCGEGSDAATPIGSTSARPSVAPSMTATPQTSDPPSTLGPSSSSGATVAPDPEDSASPDNPWAGARKVIVESGLVGEHVVFDPALSADGSQVAFSASPSFVDEIYVRAVDGGKPTIVSTTSSGQPADYDLPGLEGEATSPWEAGSFEPSLSADGAVVAFASSAVNLVPGDTNQAPGTADLRAETGFDIFVKDLRTGAVVRASTTADGSQADGESRAPSLSGDGRKVAFVSSAPNLVPGDTNDAADVFVKNLDTGAIVRVPADSEWDADKDYDEASELRRVAPALSEDASTVAFVSDAASLVAGDDNAGPDVFVQKVSGGKPVRVSRGPGSATGAAPPIGVLGAGPSLSADGNLVGFVSKAALVPEDTNRVEDVYVRDLRNGRVVRASTGEGGTQLAKGSKGRISGDGRWVVFADGRLRVKDLRTDHTFDIAVSDAEGLGVARAGDRVVDTTDDVRVFVRR